MASFDDDVGAVANQATAGNTENTIDVDSVREWVGEFFADLDEEFEQFPDERDAAQWNLMATDHSDEEPLAVVVAILADSTLTLLGGQGDGTAHFDFGEDDDFPGDAAGIEAATRAAFRMGPATARVDANTARDWSGD